MWKGKERLIKQPASRAEIFTSKGFSMRLDLLTNQMKAIISA